MSKNAAPKTRATGKGSFDPHAILERRIRERKKAAGLPESIGSADEVQASDFSPRALVEVSARQLISNARAISELVPGQALLPMVKANGYGHGAVWVARTLASQFDRLYGIGVASLEEGQEIREQVTELSRKRLPMIVFSGAAPWSEEKGLFCERYQLTPVLTTEEDFRKFLSRGWAKRIPYELKFNTGMNRLGLPFESLQRVRKVLNELPPEERPQGILSHMAVAEEPDNAITVKQVERFQLIRKELHTVSPASQFHLGNSAAIWNARALRLHELTDCVRPGLALYGITPWAGAPIRGIASVLRYTAEVIQIHTLKPGEVMGYGASYRVPSQSKQSVRVAVFNCGYADGVPRLLRGQGSQPGGFTWLGGQEARFLGVISMDLCAVQCSEAVQVGDRAEILGPQVDAWAQARVAQTIPYELYTSISPRVRRREGP